MQTSTEDTKFIWLVSMSDDLHISQNPHVFETEAAAYKAAFLFERYCRYDQKHLDVTVERVPLISYPAEVLYVEDGHIKAEL